MGYNTRYLQDNTIYIWHRFSCHELRRIL